MREGEIDGKDYNFINSKEFQKKIENNDFIEHRSYNTLINNVPQVWYYGLPKQELDPNKDYIAILDVEGTKSLLDYYGKSNCFVVSVEADDKLREQRAMSRGSFDRSEWDRRLKDDAVKLSDDEINKIANFKIYNEGELENALTDFNEAFDAYKSCKDKENVYIAQETDWSTGTEVFNAVPRDILDSKFENKYDVQNAINSIYGIHELDLKDSVDPRDEIIIDNNKVNVILTLDDNQYKELTCRTNALSELNTTFEDLVNDTDIRIDVYVDFTQNATNATLVFNDVKDYGLILTAKETQAIKDATDAILKNDGEKSIDEIVGKKEKEEFKNPNSLVEIKSQDHKQAKNKQEERV